MKALRDHVGMSNDLDSQDGFSLIEVLVTLCVVALMAGAIYGGLSHLARMRAITQAVSAEQELEASLNYLEDLISHSQNLPLMDQRGVRASVIGDAKTLRLVVQARTASDRFVLREVELSLRHDDGVVTLIEMHSPRRAPGAISEDMFPVIKGVSSLSISYLSVTEEDGHRWRDQWNADRRPSAIKITLEFVRNEQALHGERTALLRR